MAQTITHQTEGTEYATQADVEALRDYVEQAVAGFRLLVDTFAAMSLSRAAHSPRPAHSPHPARTSRPDHLRRVQ